MNSLVTIQREFTEQNFPEVLFMMLCKVVLIFVCG